MDIAIIGGGIGGLTLALALHQRGIACRVYESAPEVRELGVGITLLPHGMRDPRDGHDVVLHELAHVIDRVDGAADGTPTLHAREDFRPWCAECSLGGLRSAGRWG